MPRARVDGFVVWCVGLVGVTQILRSAPPLFLWPDPAQAMVASVQFAAGVMFVALAVGLWSGRDMRSMVVLCVPTEVVAWVLQYRATLGESGVHPLSTKALPTWAMMAAMTWFMVAFARWVWRTAPRRAP